MCQVACEWLLRRLGCLSYHSRLIGVQVLVTVLVMCWAMRLGSFLFVRVLKAGNDSRFDELKKKPRGHPPAHDSHNSPDSLIS